MCQELNYVELCSLHLIVADYSGAASDYSAGTKVKYKDDHQHPGTILYGTRLQYSS